MRKVERWIARYLPRMQRISNELVQRTLKAFCLEFIENPYLCYTEHGLHALFFSRLMDVIPEEEKYSIIYGKKMCLVQKEYPTHTDLLKGQRQHWDIAVIDKNKGANGIPEYDHLHLLAAVEFGLNEGSKHLVEDIRRLAMDDNSENKYVIHLYRISNRESRRDISPDSKSRYLSQEEAQKILDSREKKEKLITIYYGIADMVGKKSNLCRIDDDGIHRLN